MSFTCKRLEIGSHVPLCYSWDSEANTLYTAGQKGEILVFNVGPHELSSGEFEASNLSWQALWKVSSTENITSIYSRERHLLLATDGKHVQWVEKLKIGAMKSRTYKYNVHPY